MAYYFVQYHVDGMYFNKTVHLHLVEASMYSKHGLLRWYGLDASAWGSKHQAYSLSDLKTIFFFKLHTTGKTSKDNLRNAARALWGNFWSVNLTTLDWLSCPTYLNVKQCCSFNPCSVRKWGKAFLHSSWAAELALVWISLTASTFRYYTQIWTDLSSKSFNLMVRFLRYVMPKMDSWFWNSNRETKEEKNKLKVD